MRATNEALHVVSEAMLLIRCNEAELVIREALVLVRRLAYALDVDDPPWFRAGGRAPGAVELAHWLRRVLLYAPSVEQEREARKMATRLDGVSKRG